MEKIDLRSLEISSHKKIMDILRIIDVKELSQSEIISKMNRSQPVISAVLKKLYDNSIVCYRKAGVTNYYSLTEKGEFLLSNIENGYLKL